MPTDGMFMASLEREQLDGNSAQSEGPCHSSCKSIRIAISYVEEVVAYEHEAQSLDVLIEKIYIFECKR